MISSEQMAEKNGRQVIRYSLPNPANNAGAAEIDRDTREAIRKIGYDHGLVWMDPPEALDDKKRLQCVKPEPNFFVEAALRYFQNLTALIRVLKGKVSESGGYPHQLMDVAGQESYDKELSEKLEDLENNPFRSKNMYLYIPVSFFLCIGDILMGDYLAKEVLKAGESAWWQGILMGVFSMALGVVIEIMLNVFYKKGHKASMFFFNILLAISAIFALTMFIGMGFLRYTQGVASQEAALTGVVTGFPKWALMVFYIGMSAAAPMALGCVLLVIQKWFMIRRQMKALRKIQALLGDLISTERWYELHKADYHAILSSEYDLGFHEGSAKGIDNLRPKAKPIEEPGHSNLLQSLQQKVQKRFGLGAILFLGIIPQLLTSCGIAPPQADILVASESAHASIIWGLPEKEAIAIQKQSLARKTADPGLGQIAVLWPQGQEALSLLVAERTSLLSQSGHNSLVKSKNQEREELFSNRLKNSYVKSDTNFNTEQLFGMLGRLSNLWKGQIKHKKVDLWMASTPDSWVSIPDQTLIDAARSDARRFSPLYSLENHQLANTDFNLIFLENGGNKISNGDVLRKVELYFGELLNCLDAHLISVTVRSI